MREVTLKESDVSRLKEYPLGEIISTEGKIYYYKKDVHNHTSYLFKRLYHTESEKVERKIETLDQVQDSELVTYPELVFPQEYVMIQGIKSGFTIEEVRDCQNLHLFLNDRRVSREDKIRILQKIGELLRKVQAQSQEFYFGDLQAYNFLVNRNQQLYTVDLDSSATTSQVPLASKYVAIDDKVHMIPKYGVTREGKCHPSQNVDNYCYNTLVLNYLSGRPVHKLSYEEFYNYLVYLEECNLPKEFINIYRQHYTNKENESVVDYLTELPEDYGRIHYSVYSALQKRRG